MAHLGGENQTLIHNQQHNRDDIIIRVRGRGRVVLFLTILKLHLGHDSTQPPPIMCTVHILCLQEADRELSGRRNL